MRGDRSTEAHRWVVTRRRAQVIEDAHDGSVVGRFRAAGWTEIAWHLYQEHDAVEAVALDEPRETVEGYRRRDFYPVLP